MRVDPGDLIVVASFRHDNIDAADQGHEVLCPQT